MALNSARMPSSAASQIPVPLEHIGNRILLVRGHRVLLDADLAALYGVETRASDFMFRLSAKELENWRSQSVISNPGAKMGLRRTPLAFTEHGALMAATVLDSPRAVQASLYVVRAFVQLRQFLASHKHLAHRLEEHEKKLTTHDQAIAGLFQTIRKLMAPPPPPRRRPIGFVTDDQKRE